MGRHLMCDFLSSAQTGPNMVRPDIEFVCWFKSLLLKGSFNFIKKPQIYTMPRTIYEYTFIYMSIIY